MSKEDEDDDLDLFDLEPREMIDLSDMVAKPGHAPREWQSKAPDHLYTGHKPAVQNSPDLARVLALPRRPQLDLDSDRARRLVELMTRRYARPRTTPCRCAEIDPDRFKNGNVGCIRCLNAAQAWALYEIGIVQGCEGPIGVGHGKTILDLLAPLALADAWVAENQRRGVTVDASKYVVLLLVPPGLQKQLDREYQLLSQHFRVPSIVFHALPIPPRLCDGEATLHVYPYSKLSRPEATTFFRTLRPHAVIADEAHHLGDPDAVRTGRFIGYMEATFEARLCNWTGSLTDSSIEDYAHLCKYALKTRSPLPLDPEVVKEWASALDPGESDEEGGWAADPGELLEGLVRTGCQLEGEHVYVGFHRRLVETLGVVAVTSPAVDCGVEIYERTPVVDGSTDHDEEDHVPNTPREDPRAPEVEGRPAGYWPGIRDCLDMVRGGVRPDGEELLEAFPKARCARELASGFFYRWIFPRGEPESLIKRWREARKHYRREVREQMASREEHMDSPYLCQLAAMRYHGDIPRGGVQEILDEESGEVRVVDTTHLPLWASKHWPAWRDVRDLVEPAQEPVWVDEYLARDAVEWAREHTGIVWYDHAAFGHMVAKLGNIPIFGGGDDALDRLVGNKDKRIKGEDGSRSIVLSIKAHGTGRDGLQRLFWEQLVANPLASAQGWEQLLGRLHRIGQGKPETRTWFYRHTWELQKHVDRALAKALYVESTIGASQKLRMGFKLDRE